MSSLLHGLMRWLGREGCQVRGNREVVSLDHGQYSTRMEFHCGACGLKEKVEERGMPNLSAEEELRRFFKGRYCKSEGEGDQLTFTCVSGGREFRSQRGEVISRDHTGRLG